MFKFSVLFSLFKGIPGLEGIKGERGDMGAPGPQVKSQMIEHKTIRLRFLRFLGKNWP